MCRYELASGTPLVHEETNTLIFLHSVHSWHHASRETTTALLGLHPPAVLAVQCDNSLRSDASKLVAEANRITRNGVDLRHIADAYMRTVAGELL